MAEHEAEKGAAGTDRPNPFLDDYLAYLLARASQLVSSGFHAQLKDRDVPFTTWRVLASLHGGEMSVGALAAVVLLNQPTLSKVLDRLEADGLVRRRRYASRRRNVFVASTAKGRRLADGLMGAAKTHETEVLAGMKRGEATALKNALRQTIERLG